MIRNRFAAAFVAVLISAWPLATAEPAAAQSAIERGQATDLQTWMSEVAAWTQGYDALTTSRVDTLGWLLDSSDELMERLDTGGTRVARPWAASWANEARARLASEMEAFRALSTRAPTFPASVPADETMRAQIEAVGRTSAQIEALLISTGQSCEDFIRVIQAAGSGKAGDVARIEPARLGLVAAQLEAENTMVLGSTVGLSGPNLHFARSQVATNRALIVWVGHKKRLLSGQSVDPTVTARGMRAQIQIMRNEIVAMRSTSDDLEARTADIPGFGQTPLGAMIGKVLISLRQSANVEDQIAVVLGQLAAAIQSQDETAEEVVAAAIENLANQRIAIYTARIELMARSGG